jgi:hypothetical protein
LTTVAESIDKQSTRDLLEKVFYVFSKIMFE